MNLKTLFVMASAVSCVLACGCTTKTSYVAEGQTAQAVAGFSQDDIDDVLSRAVQSILSQQRIIAPEGATRAVVVVKDVVNDTNSRGSNATALAEALGIGLRENLTNSGKIVVYNENAAQYATVRVTPQYALTGRLTQRNLRQDNGDIQVEYSLNLQLIELSTGLEFWQKRIPVRKIADKSSVF